MDLFENAVFMLSCGRVKTELFENVDVKASICDVPEHAHGSLWVTREYFACLFSFIEARTAEFESSCVFVWTAIFSKALLMWTRIIFYTDKKVRFQKDPDTCGRGLKAFAVWIGFVCVAVSSQWIGDLTFLFTFESHEMFRHLHEFKILFVQQRSPGFNSPVYYL